MIRTFKLTLVAIAVLSVTSCYKDSPLDNLPDDKLLLSKISGSFQSAGFIGTNTYEFNDQGVFSTDFLYGKKTNAFVNYRPLQKINYIEGGSWDFSYNAYYPQKVSDNSFPAIYAGYFVL